MHRDVFATANVPLEQLLHVAGALMLDRHGKQVAGVEDAESLQLVQLA